MISGIKNLFSTFRSKERGANIILTGIPRSGSTLACKLLCEMPDVIGLNEPLAPELFPDRNTALTSIDKSFSNFRKSLLRKGKAPVRSKEGRVVDNAYSVTDAGNRKKVLKREEVYFDKKLTKEFTLVMKHCAEFTLLFPELLESYDCYATIRNPLALLGSWNSVHVPVSRGRVAKSKRILPEFYSKIETIDELFEKQLFILSWYFGQFKTLKEDQIIRYEDMIESNGNALTVMIPQKNEIRADLQNRNFSALYDKDLIASLGQQLLASDGAYWQFYEKSEVEQLLNQYINE